MKDFKTKWGFSYKQICQMPREKFAEMYGERFLNLSYCKFRRTVVNETPEEVPVIKERLFYWRPDVQISKKLANDLNNSFGWDEPNEIGY